MKTIVDVEEADFLDVYEEIVEDLKEYKEFENFEPKDVLNFIDILNANGFKIIKLKWNM